MSFLPMLPSASEQLLKEQGITWHKAALKQRSFWEVLLQHSLSAVEFSGTQLHAGSHPLCLLSHTWVLVLAVKGWRAGADTPWCGAGPAGNLGGRWLGQSSRAWG